MTDPDLRNIVQDVLDRQGELTIAGDIDGTLEWCDLPCTLETVEQSAVATTKLELRAICEGFVSRLAEQRISHMIRTCEDAALRQDGTLCATYETRYVVDGKLLSAEPYTGFMVLRHVEDRWKISVMKFAVGSNSPANMALRDWIRKNPPV